MNDAPPFRGRISAALGTPPAGSPGSGPGQSLAGLLLAPDRALPVPDSSHRQIWDRHAGVLDPATVAVILDRAGDDLGTPWPQPLASSAARFHRDGNRTRWETPAFARQDRLSRATAAAAITDDPAWLDEVADGVWLLCEQSSWCWPAHDDTMAVHGSVLATVDDPYLDLGAGEAVGQLAWIDQVLGPRLDVSYPGMRARIRREAWIRVLEPFVRRRDWHWLGLDGHVHNWNPWIHGNVLVAALRLLDSPDQLDLRARVVALVVEGLDRYVTVLPADGAIDEGYGYWWNGACRALEALDLLAAATGDALDVIPAIPALRETVAFPHRMHLGGPWYVAFADSQARPGDDHPWHSLHRAALRVGDATAAAHAARHRQAGAALVSDRSGLGRLLRGLVDEQWRDAVAPQGDPLPAQVWLGSTEVLVAREHEGTSAGLTLAAKGGHNAEHHNHNDVGSVIVASDGVPVVVDPGRPTYTAQTFGPDRYEIWTMRSLWHSVPVIRGTEQPAGRQYAARDVTTHLADTGARLDLDLAPAYAVPGLRRWRRTVALERGPGASVVIDDAWELDEEPGATVVQLVLAGEVHVGDGRAVVTPVARARPVVLTWPGDVPWSITVRELDDPLLTEVWGSRLTRLELDVTTRRSLRVTVAQDADAPERRRP